jgi:hypothetical protein
VTYAWYLYRASASILRTSSFLLCLCSPVLRKIICGGCNQNCARKSLDLKDVAEGTFKKALDLWCGKEDSRDFELCEVEELASVADRFQMTEVLSILEDAVMGQLSIGMCAEVLTWSSRIGLGRLEEGARRLGSKQFEELAGTAGFMGMSEEALGSLLDDDGLAARNEEAVWEAVAGWMRAGGGLLRGRGLLRKIRFPLMEEGYLRSQLAGMAPAEDAEWMAGLVAEALRAKASRRGGAGLEFELLGPKALDQRVGSGVGWAEHGSGRERRLEGHAHEVSPPPSLTPLRPLWPNFFGRPPAVGPARFPRRLGFTPPKPSAGDGGDGVRRARVQRVAGRVDPRLGPRDGRARAHAARPRRRRRPSARGVGRPPGQRARRPAAGVGPGHGRVRAGSRRPEPIYFNLF